MSAAFANTSSGFTSHIWSFGDGNTSTATAPIHTYISAGTYYVCLTLYNAGLLCSQYCDTIVVSRKAETRYYVVMFLTIKMQMGNNNEPGFGGGYVYLWGNGFQTSAYIDSFGNYTAYVPAGTYTLYYCVQQPYSLTLPPDSFGCGMYTVTIGANDTICGFDFGVANNSVIIDGYVFIDSNLNGVKDAGEAGVPYQSVQVGTYWGYTNLSGNYTIYAPAGTYTATYTPLVLIRWI